MLPQDRRRCRYKRAHELNPAVANAPLPALGKRASPMVETPDRRQFTLETCGGYLLRQGNFSDQDNPIWALPVPSMYYNWLRCRFGTVCQVPSRDGVLWAHS